MGEDEAKRLLDAYVSGLHAEDLGHAPKRWWKGGTTLRESGGGVWVAVEDPPLEGRGILLRSDGTCIPFCGALGKMVPTLGDPIAREYFLGSADLGRYQVYERGLAVWEGFRDNSNLGYPVARWDSHEERARTCHALIAFFDLRGFTNWSAEEGRKAAEVQDTIERFERAFQDAFSRGWCERLFAKGTGDGLMVVSEAGQYSAAASAVAEHPFQHGHAKAFCLACARTVANASKEIPDQLAIGCGVTVGEITQLYLLGRFDYIGPAVNEASKIQAIAYGELCLSDKADEQLRSDGVEIAARKAIPKKGIRVAVADTIAACSVG
jgi:class 3 adenylate cyclase